MNGPHPPLGGPLEGGFLASVRAFSGRSDDLLFRDLNLELVQMAYSCPQFRLQCEMRRCSGTFLTATLYVARVSPKLKILGVLTFPNRD